MRAIENAHLLVAELLDGGHKDNVQASLVEGQPALYLLVARTTNSPQVVELGLNHQIVVKAQFLLNFGNVLTGETRNDAVNESVAEVAVFLHPLHEVGAQFVVLCVAQNILPQGRAVVLNQLAADDAQTLGGVTLEVFEPLVEKGGHLCGVTLGRQSPQVVTLLVADTRLGGVRHGSLQLGREENLLIGLILLVGVEGTLHALHEANVLHGLLVLHALQIDVVEAILLLEHCGHTFVDGLHDGDAVVHNTSLIGEVNLPIYECTQEVTFAKLENLDRENGFLHILLIKCFDSHSGSVLLG